MKPLKNKNKQNETKKTKNKKRWVVFQMTCFLISTSLGKSLVSICCFQSFQDKKKTKKTKSKGSFCIYFSL